MFTISSVSGAVVAPPCHKTFTILPIWSPAQRPLQLSLPEAGSTAHGATRQHLGTVDSEPQRSGPAAGSIYIASMGGPSAGQPMVLASDRTMKLMGWRFLSEPTILAWDCPAFCRVLQIEAGGP